MHWQRFRPLSKPTLRSKNSQSSAAGAVSPMPIYSLSSPPPPPPTPDHPPLRTCMTSLLRRKDLKSRSNLLLPRHADLPIDLSTELQVLSIVEQDGANDVLVIAHDGLVVVDVGGAVAAVVAVDWFAYAIDCQ